MAVYLTLTGVLGLLAYGTIRLGDRGRNAALTGRPQAGAPAISVGSRLRTVAGIPDYPSVSVIIPTLNEASSLPWVLEHLPGWVSEVVLVDGLSSDQTEAVARRCRPGIVVVHQHTPGKGAALRAGFVAATGDIVVMIDADGSTDPREMHRFVDALRTGGDLVKGSRRMHGGGSADFTRVRSAGNRGFVLLANVLYGSCFTDLCYGYCAFWRHHLDALALTADGFEIETQLVINAVEAGLAIREVPSYELERRAGSSNLNAIRDGVRVLKTLLGKLGPNSSLSRRRPISLIAIQVSSSATHSSRHTLLVDRRQRGPTVGAVRHDRRHIRRRLIQASPSMERHFLRATLTRGDGTPVPPFAKHRR